MRRIVGLDLLRGLAIGVVPLRHAAPVTSYPTGRPPLALTGVPALAVVPLRGHVLTYLAGGPAIAALTADLLLSWRTWTELSGPPMLLWLGTPCYVAYLWSCPLTLWLRPHVEYAGPLAAVPTVAAAAVSWHAVERPLQARRRLVALAA